MESSMDDDMEANDWRMELWNLRSNGMVVEVMIELKRDLASERLGELKVMDGEGIGFSMAVVRGLGVFFLGIFLGK